MKPEEFEELLDWEWDCGYDPRKDKTEWIKAIEDPEVTDVSISQIRRGYGDVEATPFTKRCMQGEF